MTNMINHEGTKEQIYQLLSELSKEEQCQIAKSIASGIVKSDLLYELQQATRRKAGAANTPSADELSDAANKILENSFLREIACPRLANYKDCPAAYQNEYFNLLIKKAEEYAESYEQQILSKQDEERE